MFKQIWLLKDAVPIEQSTSAYPKYYVKYIQTLTASAISQTFSRRFCMVELSLLYDLGT